MAIYFEIQNGVINNAYDVNNPQPDIDHTGATVVGITWLARSGDFRAGDLYDGTTLSYGAASIAEAREWRDGELSGTDDVSGVADHPEHAAYITYRQSLRDWPTTTDFPATRPIL